MITFSDFHLFHFVHFDHFGVFSKCAFWCFDHFHIMALNCNKALLRWHKGEWWYVWWFSPHCVCLRLLFYCVWFMSGRLHRRGVLIIQLSFSPLWTGVIKSIPDKFFDSDVGEITQGRDYVVLSFSPLLNRFWFFFSFILFSGVGEIHRRGEFLRTLVLPLWTEIEYFLRASFLTTF